MLDFIEGETLLVDKPLRWTSFDVVKKIKHLLKKNLGVRKIKVGHAGTLDPLATGLLVICTGKKTKSIPEIQEMGKVYTGTMVIGAQTASYDLESPVEKQQAVDHISEDDLHKAKDALTGTYLQYPPIFSAKKIDGKRAYKLARKGQEPIMRPKEVQVHQFDITDISLPEIDFEIACAKGTYIRSMAHDLGQNIGVGAYLKELRRTEIGNYKVSAAHSIEEIEQLILKTTQQLDC